MQAEIFDQIYLQCDQNSWIFAHPLDDKWAMQSKTKSNVISVLNEFMKMRLLLQEELKEINEELTQKMLSDTTYAYKFALMNETGIRLVGWIENFQEFNPTEADPFDIDLSMGESEVRFFIILKL